MQKGRVITLDIQEASNLILIAKFMEKKRSSCKLCSYLNENSGV